MNTDNEPIEIPFYASIDEVKSCNWLEVLNSCERRNCMTYASAFAEAADEALSGGEIANEKVFRMLWAVCWFVLNLADDRGPFLSYVAENEGHSPRLVDFHDIHYEPLRHIALTCEDSELQSRVADILWERDRDFTMGELAIKAYLQPSVDILNTDKMHLDDDNHDAGFIMIALERAVQIVCQLSRKDELWNSVSSHCETFLNQAVEGRCFFYAKRSLEIIYKNKLNCDADKCAEFAEAMGSSFTDGFDDFKSAMFFELAASLWKKAGNPDKSLNAKMKIGETYEKAYEFFKNAGSDAFLQALRVDKAIVAYRRVGNKEGIEKADSLLPILKELNRQHAKEMPLHETKVDTSGHAEFAHKLVAGKTPWEALIAMSRTQLCTKEDVLDYLRRRNSEGFVAQFLVSSYVIDKSTGNTIAGSPPLDKSELESEETCMIRMIEAAKDFQSLDWAITASYALQEFVKEYKDWEIALIEMIRNNPFIPEGREEIYYRGIRAGFSNDWLLCTHLLIPQVENSFRYILEINDVLVTKYTSEYTQEEVDLNVMLSGHLRCETETIFTEDIVFDLRTLLVEKHGHNLRNSFAHGLLEIEDNSFSVGIYFLWTVLRLVVTFHVLNTYRQQGSS